MATIVSAVGSLGSWTSGASWIGGVAPTAADDAQIQLGTTLLNVDNGAVCRSADFTAFLGTLTQDATSVWYIGDGTAGLSNIALLMVGGMTYSPLDYATSSIEFKSTSATQQTIATGGKTLISWTINGVDSSYLLSDNNATDAGSTVKLTSGTLDTNGNICTWGFFDSSGAVTRVLTLGASTITCAAAGATAWNCATTTNMTVNANTSTITLSGAAGGFNNAGTAGTAKTYYGVLFTGSGTPVFNGGGTYTNITRTGTAVKTDTFQINTDFTVTGTLTLTGNSVINRIFVQTNSVGTVKTITNTGATMTWSNVNLRDITLGTSFNASAITGLSGDCGGNSGITFTTAATQTSTGTASFTWSTHGWTSRVPLPQDNVVINNAFVASQTVTIDMPRLGKDLDFTGATGTPKITNSVTITMYGSLIFISGFTSDSFVTASNWTFEGRGSHTISMGGFQGIGGAANYLIQAVGGTYTLLDAFASGTTSARALQVTHGTFNANGFNVTVASFNSNFSNTRSVTMGSGTWTMAGTGTVWNTSGITGLTFAANTSTIQITSTSATARTFSGGGLTYNNLWSNAGASTASLTIVGSNTFSDFKDSGTAAHSILFTAASTQTVTTFTVTGTAGNLISINSTTTAIHTLVKSGGGTISSNYLNIQHSVATPATTWYAGANSTDNQAVATAGSGWIFTAPPAGGNTSSMFFQFM